MKNEGPFSSRSKERGISQEGKGWFNKRRGKFLGYVSPFVANLQLSQQFSCLVSGYYPADSIGYGVI